MEIIQKYIPKTLDEMYGLQNEKKILKKCIDTNTNILLNGSYGTGKTLIKDLIIKHKNINPKDIFIFNSDIHFKKDKLQFLLNFVKSSTLKIAIIDGFKEITQDNQNLLKSLIKNYVKNVIFILCIDDNTHLTENLSQYFVNIKIKSLKVCEYKKYITNIFDNEKIKYNDKIINRIVNNSNNFHDINNNICKLIINHNSGLDIIKNYLKILDMNDLLIVNKIFTLCEENNQQVFGFVDKLIINGFSCENIFNSMIKYIYNIKLKTYEKKIFFIKLLMKYEMNNNISYTSLFSLIIEMMED